MFGRSKRVFTVMLIPHSERAVTTLRIPLSWLQLFAFGVVAVLLSLLVFAHKYQQMAIYMDELYELRAVNRQQREEVEFLAAQTEALQAGMRRLDELDRQLRELLKAGGAPPEVAAGLDEIGQPAAAESDAAIASAASRHVGLTGTGGGFTPASTSIVSLDALREAEAMRLTLAELGQEMAVREETLEALRERLLRYLTFLEAKPAGWPVQGYITSGFGWRRSPFGGGSEFHEGIDIAAPYGTPIVATGAGTVIFSGWRDGFGNTVIVDHGFGFRTQYNHNQRNAVTAGTQVKRGQVIAYLGNTGRSTGPHVHYEVILNGKPVNPWPYLVQADNSPSSIR